MSIFKDDGYFLEYYVNGKFIGTKLIDEPDRQEIGYYSKIDSVAEQNIVLQSKKIIKQGTKYYTRMYPLCGKKI
jgi:hypothetical protein